MGGKKLVEGVGINDTDIETKKSSIYSVWTGILKRCYNKKCQEKNKSYIGCEISKDWILFSNFESWCRQQEYLNLDLDKDVIKMGNKFYSEEFCSFIPRYVNISCVTRSNLKGDYPLGVAYCNNGFNLTKPYIAQGSGGEKRYLGYFSTKEDAHLAWQINKRKIIQSVMDRYKLEKSFDKRVALGLEFRLQLLQDDIYYKRITETL